MHQHLGVLDATLRRHVEIVAVGHAALASKPGSSHETGQAAAPAVGAAGATVGFMLIGCMRAWLRSRVQG